MYQHRRKINKIFESEKNENDSTYLFHPEKEEQITYVV